MMMAKGKLIALAGAAMAVLLVSPAAQADLAELTIRAGGVLVDGAGAPAGSANVMVTVPDGPDEGTLPDPVEGIRIHYMIGDVEVACDPDIATTDPTGIARCGLLVWEGVSDEVGTIADVIANGGYDAVFTGDDIYAAKTDHGGLIHQQGTDIP